jgi:hypothetical protein
VFKSDGVTCVNGCVAGEASVAPPEPSVSIQLTFNASFTTALVLVAVVAELVGGTVAVMPLVIVAVPLSAAAAPTGPVSATDTATVPGLVVAVAAALGEWAAAGADTAVVLLAVVADRRP